MPQTPTQIRERRAAAVTRLTEVVARHEAKGDLKTAAVFTDLLLEAQDRLRETVTHVRVGDHTPEPRRTMRLDSYDADGHYGAEYRDVAEWIDDNRNDGSGRPR